MKRPANCLACQHRVQSAKGSWCGHKDARGTGAIPDAKQLPVWCPMGAADVRDAS